MSQKVSIESLENEIKHLESIIQNRDERIKRGEVDEDDCFISMKVNSDGIKAANMKINIIKGGGTAWFDWYKDMNGVPCTDANWVQTKYGLSLCVNFADGRTVWTTATTEKGLAKKGLVKVEALFPAWVKSYSHERGLLGVFNSSVGIYRAELNRATGEYHPEPYEIRELETQK